MVAPEQALGEFDEGAESWAVLEAPPTSPLTLIRATIGAIRAATLPALTITGMIGMAT